MKRILLALLAALLIAPMGGAWAETAADIPGRCVVTAAPGAKGKENLRDASYLTYYTGRYLEIRTPEESPCFGLYICFSGVAAPYRVLSPGADGAWREALTDNRGYVNSYVALPGLAHLRIEPADTGLFSIARLFVLGAGETPEWVQDWQPFEGKADLMVLSAHADDELLFFGGVIPYYAAQEKKNVIVCYLTDQTPCRRNELLDGLWTCGVRSYPHMGAFKDIKNHSLGDSYSFWGREPVLSYVTALIRRYQPDVLLTHDIRGEYGHGAHRVCADAAIRCFDLAAQADYMPASGAPWQVRKLYLHLYAKDESVFDWRQPLAAFGGKTAFDVVKAAFACHASQRSNGLRVEDSGPYANNRFGLYASTVGEDERGGNLFEHLP